MSECKDKTVKEHLKIVEHNTQGSPKKMTRLRLNSEGQEETPDMAPHELPSACPRKSGSVIMWMMVGGVQRKQRVVLRVYKSYFDCYAVVSQDKVLCKDCGYISLKNSTCVVSNSQPNTFQITPKNKEGQSLKFSVQHPTELNSWMEELQEISGQSQSELNDMPKSPRRVLAPISPRMRHAPTKTPMLPSLDECGEENEE